MELNIAAILQTVIAALLVGAGTLLYKGSITLAQLQRDLIAHTEQDRVHFTALEASDAHIEESIERAHRRISERTRRKPKKGK